MRKGYWIGAYRVIRDRSKLAEYVRLAGPAIESQGGRFLSRNGAIEVHEGGILERTVLIEFESFEAACTAYRSERYQQALAALGDGAERDVRIIDGVDYT